MAVRDIPIEHLEYNYIQQCSNPTELENILKRLRSKSDGYYPDLIRFTENKLQSVKPESKLLIKDQKIKRATELSYEDLKELKRDIDKWECTVTKEDEMLSDANEHQFEDLPPIRSSSTINSSSSHETNTKSSNRIKSNDYSSWDKYDTERGEVEECVIENKPTKKAPAISPHLSAKEIQMSPLEKERQATREREKGNEAFRAGDYQEALVYYSRSIQFFPSAAAYNNKALMCNKLGRYDDAIKACNEVLKLEPNNAKGFVRRANAQQSLKQFEAAVSDLEKALQIEPNNKRAQEMLLKIQKENKSTTQQQLDKEVNTVGGKVEKKGKRLKVEDIEEDQEEQIKSQPTPPTTDPPIIDSTPAFEQPRPLPLPPEVQKLKDEGNNMFRTGQYGTAVEVYNKCIGILENEPDDHTHSLALILSNRAACHLKNGDCNSCISDCSHSIELSPVNLKAFMRRAQAYEAMEKYKKAYSDYQIALRIDSRVDTARTACSRISRLLREQLGNNWRDSLPINPDNESVTAGLEIALATPPTTDHMTTQSNDQSLPPSIPVITSTASNITTYVSQSTATMTTSITNTNDKHKFEELKNKGNAFVKQCNYPAAIDYYSQCISICPLEVAPYTNRALCSLKQDNFEFAEEDCSKALELDPNNVKALYRRALARKGLRKFIEALKDLKTLTVQEPDNAPAKKEEKIVHDLYLKQLRELQATQEKTIPAAEKNVKTSSKKSNAKKSTAPAADSVAKQQQTKRKKVVIEEVSDEETGNVDKEVKLTNTTSDKQFEKVKRISEIKQESLTISQYRHLWNSITNSASPYDYAVILKKIPPANLPQEGHTLTGIIAAIDQYILHEDLHELTYDILISLTNVERFSMVLMFLKDSDKNVLLKIFSSLPVSSIDLSKLKQLYKL